MSFKTLLCYFNLTLSLFYLTYAQTQYTFYIDNTWQGSYSDGTLEYPFPSITQSFSSISNFNESNITIYLLPTAQPYALGIYNPLIGVAIETAFLNCTTFDCEKFAQLYMDVKLQTSNFSISLININIVDNQTSQQSIIINSLSLVLSMLNVTITTNNSIQFVFEADQITSSVQNILVQSTNLENTLLTFKINSHIDIQILNLNCTVLVPGLIKIDHLGPDGDCKFHLEDAYFASQTPNSMACGQAQFKSDTKTNLISLSNVNKINISNVTFGYELADQFFMLLQGDFEELSVQFFNILPTNNYQNSKFFQIEVANPMLAGNIIFDNILFKENYFDEFVKLISYSPILNISLTNIELNNMVNVNTLFLLEYNVQYQQYTQTSVLQLANWTIKDSTVNSLIYYYYTNTPNEVASYVNFDNITFESSQIINVPGNVVSLFLFNSLYNMELNINGLNLWNVNFQNVHFLEQDTNNEGNANLFNLNIQNSTFNNMYFFFTQINILSYFTMLNSTINNLTVIGENNDAVPLFIMSYLHFSVTNCIFNNMNLNAAYLFYLYIFDQDDEAVVFNLSSNIISNVILDQSSTLAYYQNSANYHLQFFTTANVFFNISLNTPLQSLFLIASTTFVSTSQNNVFDNVIAPGYISASGYGSVQSDSEIVSRSQILRFLSYSGSAEDQIMMISNSTFSTILLANILFGNQLLVDKFIFANNVLNNLTLYLG